MNGDQFEVNQKMPLTAAPGTAWAYNTVAYHMLYRLIEKATGENLEAYAQRKLFGPLGMEHHRWIKSQSGAVTNYYRLQCSTRNLGRFRAIRTPRRCLGGPAACQQTVLQAGHQPFAGPEPRLWLLVVAERPGVLRNHGRSESRHGKLEVPGRARDLVAAMGAEGQNVLIVPSLDLVVVRQGESPRESTMAANLLRQVILAIKDQ